MSLTASVHIRFYSPSTKSVYQALLALLDYGWSFGDRPTYYPNVAAKVSDDDFEQVEVPKEKLDELLKRLETYMSEGKAFRVILLFKDTGQKACFTFITRKRHHLISVHLSGARRPRLEACPRYTDTGWFIQRIVPPIYDLFDIYRVTTSDG